MNSKEQSERKEAIVYTVDSYADGVSFGRTRVASSETWRDELKLKLIDDSDLLRFRRHFQLDQAGSVQALEAELMNLSQKGILGRSHIVFGTTTDPFFPFDRKFDGTMKFLKLMQRYTPGLLTIQTRSPLIVIAMPVLTQMKAKVGVTIGIETNNEDAARRYTPGLPRPEERIKAARSLRNFGVQVTAQTAPILPYGDWKKSAVTFAEDLISCADFIYARPLLDGSERNNAASRSMYAAKTMAQDRKFHWLRADSANPVLTAIEVLAPQKLRLPANSNIGDKQLKMFAA